MDHREPRSLVVDPANGKLTFLESWQLQKQRLADNVSIQGRTRDYWGGSVGGTLKEPARARSDRDPANHTDRLRTPHDNNHDRGPSESARDRRSKRHRVGPVAGLWIVGDLAVDSIPFTGIFTNHAYETAE